MKYATDVHTYQNMSHVSYVIIIRLFNLFSQLPSSTQPVTNSGWDSPDGAPHPGLAVLIRRPGSPTRFHALFDISREMGRGLGTGGSGAGWDATRAGSYARCCSFDSRLLYRFLPKNVAGSADGSEDALGSNFYSPSDSCLVAKLGIHQAVLDSKCCCVGRTPSCLVNNA